MRRVPVNWWSDLPTIALFVLLLSTLFQLVFITRSLRFISPDTAFFVWSGAQMAAGRLPYVHYWDIKPPAIHEFLGLIGLLTGGDPHTIALSGLMLSIWFTVLMLYIIARTIFTITQSEYAAFAALLTPLVLKEFYLNAVLDIRVQLYTAVFSVVAIQLFVRRREGLAAGAAGLAAAFWQPGIGMIGVILLGAWRRHKLRRAIGGLGAVTIAVLAPFVLQGTIDPVVAQTVLSPFITERSEPLLESLLLLTDSLDVGLVVVVAGVLGIYLERRIPHRYSPTEVWVIFGSLIWYAAYLLLISFDGLADMPPFLATAALAVGVTVGLLPSTVTDPDEQLRFNPRLVVVGAIVLAVGIELLWLRNWPLGIIPTNTSKLTMFMNSSGCHVRLSYQERWWMDYVRESSAIHHCGNIEYVRLVREWVAGS
jgi:hypothetical protein